MHAGHRSRRRLARVADALGASARGGVNDNYLDNFDRDSLRAQEGQLPSKSTLGGSYNSLNYTEAEIFQPDGHCDYYGSKGFLSPSPKMREDLLRIPTAELAPATVPEVCRSATETPPALWDADDWRQLVERQQREPLFDMEAVRRQYSEQSFRDDGFCVFREFRALLAPHPTSLIRSCGHAGNVMTPETQRQWTQAMMELQDLNDRLVLSDWATAVDWRTLRVKPPTSFHTAEEKQSAVGGAQRLKPMNDDNGGFAMRLHGILPEYFPPAHSPYLMFAMFHPQLLAIHKMVLESDDVYYSTAQSNSKRPGDPGARWHSHGGMPSFNDRRIRTPEEYIQEGCM